MEIVTEDTCPKCGDWILCAEVFSEDVVGLTVEVQAVVWCPVCGYTIWQDWTEDADLIQQDLFEGM